MLHGLRQIQGISVVDTPRLSPAYIAESPTELMKYRGNGFSLFGMLSDSPELQKQRDNWKNNLHSYDIVLFSFPSIHWKNLQFITAYRKTGSPLIMIDGTDYPAFFPYDAIWTNLRNFPKSFLPWQKSCIVYKREWITEKSLGTLSSVVPKGFIRLLTGYFDVRSIHFGFPSSKITKVKASQKTKIFSAQIIDPDVAARLPENAYNPIRSNQLMFDTEGLYYKDLQASRFGITGKRAGWDCLRHYEMAANGVVLCFKDLDKKPVTCAPHGLNTFNSINYLTYEDLSEKLLLISDENYDKLLDATYIWIESQTTYQQAKRLVDDFEELLKG